MLVAKQRTVSGAENEMFKVKFWYFYIRELYMPKL